MATQSLIQSTLTAHPANYQFREVQLVVRETPSLPAAVQPFVGLQFSSSRQVFESLADLAALETEAFLCFHLDSKNLIKALQVVSIGSMTASLAHPREVFRGAVLNGAVGVIVAHNHPSGDPSPSTDDVQLTHRLEEVGKLLGIRLLDHVVVGRGSYFSFADQGLI